MKKSIQVLLALVLCLAMVFSMVACTKEAEKPTPTEAGTETETEPETETETEPEVVEKEAEVGVSYEPVTVDGVDYCGTIKIGTVSCEAGAYASVGGPYSGFLRLYIAYINKVLGGVAHGADGLGYYLDWYHYDEGGDGALGATYVQTLVEDDQVFSMVGNLGTWIIVAAQEYIVESGVPEVYWGTGSSFQYYAAAEGNQRFTYPVQPIYTTEGRIIYLRAKNMPTYNENVTEVKKIGVLYSSTDDGVSSKAGIEEQASYDTDANKPEIVYVQVNSTVADELTSQIQQVEDCDVIVASCNQTYFKAIYTAMSANATVWGKPIISEYVNIAPTTVPDAGRTEGASPIYGGAWVILDQSAESRQVEDFVRFSEICDWGVENGDIDADSAAQWKISAYAMSSFIAMDVFMTGLNRLADQSITRENFNTAMESEPIAVPISGYVDYANGARVGLDRMSFVMFDAGVNTFVSVDPMKTIEDLLG